MNSKSEKNHWGWGVLLYNQLFCVVAISRGTPKGSTETKYLHQQRRLPAASMTIQSLERRCAIYHRCLSWCWSWHMGWCLAQGLLSFLSVSVSSLVRSGSPPVKANTKQVYSQSLSPVDVSPNSNRFKGLWGLKESFLVLHSQIQVWKKVCAEQLTIFLWDILPIYIVFFFSWSDYQWHSFENIRTCTYVFKKTIKLLFCFHFFSLSKWIHPPAHCIINYFPSCIRREKKDKQRE